jgi:hypothetical protein
VTASSDRGSSFPTTSSAGNADANANAMKTRISSRGIKLTAIQRSKLNLRLAYVLGRFGDRVDRVIVRLSDAEGLPGYKHCHIEVGIRLKFVSAEHSDINIFQAVEHAATRVARSVSRTIEGESPTIRR